LKQGVTPAFQKERRFFQKERRFFQKQPRFKQKAAPAESIGQFGTKVALLNFS
jgi:hypothetical protein